ncbi:AsmA-like C-terminal region-containing protein [Sphingomonas sp. H39-1-10]|uniref:AsmA family protein n=1 Tax=Sphingomonas pollutisoli TaxID=3030829 RepID=UPI0023B8EA9A|nr:AsmA-like C-terminal region-containing protein [Sphingomonas pollutisoli]MDF0487231.1 AsmA-like C-terminal region-containing protein [Sphingomonas pollutisoli]
MAMTPATRSLLRRAGWAGLIVAGLAALLALALGALPFGLLRPAIERRIAARLGAPAHIGAIRRLQAFSYTPDIVIEDVRIEQPGWVGGGDFLRARAVTMRLPVFKLLFGGVKPDALVIDGLEVALVRDASGRSNWKGRPRPADAPPATTGPGLTRLTVRDGRLSLRDAKRQLSVSGPFEVTGASGLRLAATGTFLGTPARLDVTGGRIDGIDPAAAWPVELHLVSPALRLEAKGTTDGVLNTHRFGATVTARAPTLKNLDRAIEAGLFGTRPIALIAQVRHDARDWYLDRIGGGIGRSRFVGKASILKRDGRTRIDAQMRASQFDFDDLADDAGRARAAASKAAIGPRVLPPTRINLSHLWRTDGTIAFRVDHLLSGGGTVFRTLRGELRLDHQVLTVDRLVATLATGRMTGVIRVDHRSGRPKLSTDLRLEGMTLDTLVGSPDDITGIVRGRIALSGQGDTVREALSHADGSAAIVSNAGTIKAVVADVLGQDLGGTIKQAILHPSERVPLRCLVAAFRARGGVLTPNPLAIDTGSSIGRGSGRIDLRDERIALTLAGRTRDDPALRIVDPIRIGGTLSKPAIAIAGSDAPSGKPGVGGFFKALGRSIGEAIGLGDKPAPRPAFAPLDCARLSAAALR